MGASFASRARLRELPHPDFGTTDGSSLPRFCLLRLHVPRSDRRHGLSGKGSDLLLQICQYLGSTVYISGAAAKGYLDVAAFAAARIEVVFQEYHYPVYPQRHGDFAAFLSYLDMLFNVGLDRETVLAGGRSGPDTLTRT